MKIEFKECPLCNGYGITDSGRKCRECNGSGELMFDKETGRQITHKELIQIAKHRDNSIPT